MADSKISALTALTGANVDPVADVLSIVDTSVTTTKKILISELALAMRALQSEVSVAAGTSVALSTTIPTWAQKITVMFNAVSTNGTSGFELRIGDAGGIEATNYVSRLFDNTSSAASTTGFIVAAPTFAAADTWYGTYVLTLQKASTWTWTGMGNVVSGAASNYCSGAGFKATSQATDRISIFTVNGTDAFDGSGTVSIMWE